LAPSPLPGTGPRHPGIIYKESKMNLDYLSRLLTPPLEERAAHEGRALAGNSTEPLEVDAYFKEVFAGQIL